jgi:transcriptional regulator of acetoin/glycerol metabolism
LYTDDVATDETLDQTWAKRPNSGVMHGPAIPGVVVVFSGSLPALTSIPLRDGKLSLGRGDLGGTPIEDACMSRRHAEIELRNGRWTVRDLNSRNGTFVEGNPVVGEQSFDEARVARVGDTLLLIRRDIRPFVNAAVELRGAVVIGPTLRWAWDEISRAARSAETLHVKGETGAGKELAARHFHEAGPFAGGPFVGVNCAAIPPQLAERLLFGSRRGAYSGADSDAEGYLQAADGGTLFLDEVAELQPDVQAKLLRVLESREVLPLGASKARKVSVRIVSATHGELRTAAAEGKFREDLYFRLGRPSVNIPALRERAEDIPWIIQSVLRASQPALALHVSLVEQALLRHWPGNVRELATEIDDAARSAVAVGSKQIKSKHFSASAGLAMSNKPDTKPPSSDGTPKREAIEAALRREGGNVARTARVLGMHRTQLRRIIARLSIDPRALATADGSAGGDDDNDNDDDLGSDEK